MKLVPNAIGRKIAQRGLLASENSPKILFVGGVVGMLGSTVLACRSTLKLEEVLDEVAAMKKKSEKAKHVVDSGQAEEGTTYTEQEYKKDLVLINIKGFGSVVRLYAPSILLGGLSIAALTKSHNILQDRTVALTAAYAAVDTAFKNYRERVIERFGEDADRDMRYDSEQVDVVDDKGKVVSTTRVTDAPGSVYARFYDEFSSRNWSPDPDINLLFLNNQQCVVNDRLRARGHLVLNDVFTELGMEHTEAGCIVGWRWNKDSGDDYIDFGHANGSKQANDFFNGREGAILLDFNVDGVIFDKIEEGR